MAEKVNVTITRSIGGGRVFNDGDGARSLVTGKMYPMSKKDARYWVAQGWAVYGDDTAKYRELAKSKEEADREAAIKKAASLEAQAKRLEGIAKGIKKEVPKVVKVKGRKPRV